MGYGVGQRPASLPAILSATRGGDLSLVASFLFLLFSMHILVQQCVQPYGPARSKTKNYATETRR